MNTKLHPAQVATLYTLRRSQSARFRDLLRSSGLGGDGFKFHLQKLVKLGLIEKHTAGYTLTAVGKEFANNLDRASRTTQKQPKLSMVLVVRNDSGHFLFHQRKRNPYFDFWGCISAPVRWGELPEIAAARELKKQAGFEAKFYVHGFYRQRDYDTETKEMLEDKLFTVLHADAATEHLNNHWSGGVNRWMAPEDLKRQEKFFANTEKILALEKNSYLTGSTFYNQFDY